MKNKMFLIALIVVGLFVALFIALKQGYQDQPQPIQSGNSEAQQGSSSFKMVPVDQSLLLKPHAPVKGAFSAQVTVVEFLDPECEACGATYPMVKKLFEEYKSEIRFVVRYMTYHQNSKYVANILEGARAEDKYWEALELLFQTQDKWANHQNPNPDLIPEILQPLKLNIKKIISDAKNGKYDKQISEDFEDGKAVGVRGTPTFFVNGHQVQELGYESLKREIEARLNRK